MDINILYCILFNQSINSINIYIYLFIFIYIYNIFTLYSAHFFRWFARLWIEWDWKHEKGWNGYEGEVVNSNPSSWRCRPSCHHTLFSCPMLVQLQAGVPLKNWPPINSSHQLPPEALHSKEAPRSVATHTPWSFPGYLPHCTTIANGVICSIPFGQVLADGMYLCTSMGNKLCCAHVPTSGTGRRTIRTMQPEKKSGLLLAIRKSHMHIGTGRNKRPTKQKHTHILYYKHTYSQVMGTEVLQSTEHSCTKILLNRTTLIRAFQLQALTKPRHRLAPMALAAQWSDGHVAQDHVPWSLAPNKKAIKPRTSCKVWHDTGIPEIASVLIVSVHIISFKPK